MADEKRCVVDGDPEAEAEEKEASRGAEMYQVEREEKKILKLFQGLRCISRKVHRACLAGLAGSP